jgi:threonine synthase
MAAKALSSWLPTSGVTGSSLSYLEGSLSGVRYDCDELATVDPLDGRPLLARYELERIHLTPETLARRGGGGLWRWQEILPVRDWRHVVSLGEGRTPLLQAERLGRSVGVSNLYLKSESLNPTGSFKARGMAVAVSRALELGAKSVIAPSAGNAAGALAAYAAAAELPAIVVMPTDAPLANRVEVVVTGAQLILLEGLIDDCGRLAHAIAQKTGSFDMSTLKEPYRVEGKKTMGLELAEDLQWTLPDAILYPTGGGTGLVGMWKAFAELEELGLIDSRRPRMFSVQAEGCAPIVRAFETEQEFAERWAGANTAAGGIRVPSAIGDFLILRSLRESGGGAIAVPEDEILRMQEFVAQQGQGFLSLETCAAVAAVPALRAEGTLEPTDRVVVFDTGAGFKSGDNQRLTYPEPIPNDPAYWHEFVEGLS